MITSHFPSHCFVLKPYISVVVFSRFVFNTTQVSHSILPLLTYKILFMFNFSAWGGGAGFLFCRFEEMERATTSIGKEKEDVSDIVAEENRKRKRKLEKKEKEKAADKAKRYRDSFKF